MEKNNKVAVVCCSNGQSSNYRDKIKHLKDTLAQIGLVPVFSDFIYEKDSVFSGTGEERAKWNFTKMMKSKPFMIFQAAT